MEISTKLRQLLENVGDMSLKRRVSRIILDLELKSKDKIIDLGCGDGFYLHILKNLPVQLNLIGLDHDKLVLKNAAKNLRTRNIKLIEGDIAKIPFKGSIFKKAIMTEVLEHIGDERKALSEVYRILKPNGILVLTVPSFDFPFLWDPVNYILQNLFGTHIKGTNFFAGIWARHEKLYKKTHLKKLITKTGFKIEKIEELTTHCLPFNHYLINFIARLLYDHELPAKITDPLSKFKHVRKSFLIGFTYYLVNLFDKLNDTMPGKNGLNLYVKAVKIISTSKKQRRKKTSSEI